MLVELRTEEIARASGMSEEMVNGDLVSQLFVGIIGEVPAERIIEMDLAGLCQLEHCGRGEHLVHRADAKLRVERVRNLLLPACHTVNGREYRLSVFRNQRRSGNIAVSSRLVEVPAKDLERLRFRQAGDRKFGGARNGAKFDPFDIVRLVAIDLHDDSGKLVGIPFLHKGRTFRDIALFGFLRSNPPVCSRKPISRSTSSARAG